MILSKLSPRSQSMLRTVRGLPLRIGYHMELIESFMIDRKAVQTEKQLKAFTKHWNSVWKIPWDKRWTPTRKEKQLVSGRYNARLALRCINKNGPDGVGCSHINNNKHCISADIMAPHFLLRLMELRHHFGVPDGVIIMQLFGALHDDLKEVDPDEITDYLNDYRQPREGEE